MDIFKTGKDQVNIGLGDNRERGVCSQRVFAKFQHHNTTSTLTTTQMQAHHKNSQEPTSPLPSCNHKDIKMHGRDDMTCMHARKGKIQRTSHEVMAQLKTSNH